VTVNTHIYIFLALLWPTSLYMQSP
jgi:hypothetical protein